MKNMRIPLLVVLAVAILGIVLGSFFDLQISTAIASADNGFALFLSAIGPTIAFASISAIGGGFIRFALKKDYPIYLRIIFWVLAIACYAVPIYYTGGEYFGLNGFNKTDLEWLGYLIVILPELAALVGGYFLFRNCENKNMWIIFIIIIVLLTIIILGIVSPLKDVVHRPRYRLIAKTGVEFHNWWEPCKNYKELIALNNTSVDNFKSYPSGHTTEASILLFTTTFLPLAGDKYKKYQLPLFTCSCALIVIVAFARILAAAHFLSDVSTGATIVVLILLITNEIVSRIKNLQPNTQNIE
jgi:membrane-associated phospholipid phosphatase